MKQQTAVDWLSNLIDMQFPSINIKWKEWMIDRAKQMEKEQIITAFDIACEDEDRIGEEYYNDIFGGQGSPDTTTSPNTQNK